MRATPLPDLILYGRADCAMCDEARSIIRALLDRRAAEGRPTPAFIERDISTDPAWERTYHASIPVVELGDRRLETVTSVAKLRRLLDEVLDGAIVPTP